MKNYLISSAVLSCLFLISCGSEEAPTVPPPPTYPVVKVDTMDVPVNQLFVGEILGHTDIPIRARVSGFLNRVYFNEGTEIEEGSPLYLIDPQPFQEKVATANSKVQEARTRYVNAKNDYDRIAPLGEINAVSQSDVDAADANMKAAKASLSSAISQLNIAKIELGYTEVQAPVSGLVGKSLAVEGEFVGQFPNPVILTTISNIDSVLVEFYLPEKDYLALHNFYSEKRDSSRVDSTHKDNIQEGNNRNKLYLQLSDGSQFKYPGFAKFINREVDPKTGTILIQAIFPNPNHLLRPGQFARVLVKTNTIDNAIVVPQRCIAETQGRFRVNVINDSNQVEYRYIETGPKYGDYWVVTRGLDRNEQVMLEGIQRVREGQTIKKDDTEFESQRL